jgi:PKD repeat protein
MSRTESGRLADGLTELANGTRLCVEGMIPPWVSMKGGPVNKRTFAACGIAVGVLLLAAACVYVGNIQPVAIFTATPTSGNSKLDVDFDASASYDPDGSITTYAWDFGDGQTASHTIATTSHQFEVQSDSEVFRVVLTVTDNVGAQDQAFKDITVNPSP